MRDRILDWLRREHGDPEMRTIRGLAAMLGIEQNDVLLTLAALEREGLIRQRREHGREIYIPTFDPPQSM